MAQCRRADIVEPVRMHLTQPLGVRKVREPGAESRPRQMRQARKTPQARHARIVGSSADLQVLQVRQRRQRGELGVGDVMERQGPQPGCGAEDVERRDRVGVANGERTQGRERDDLAQLLVAGIGDG